MGNDGMKEFKVQFLDNANNKSVDIVAKSSDKISEQPSTFEVTEDWLIEAIRRSIYGDKDKNADE